MKTLEKYQDRNFKICSDCIYFEQRDIIDERYPFIKEGFCAKYHKRVTNLNEVICQEFCLKFKCKHCVKFEYGEDICTKFEEECDPDEAICENFEE